MQSHVQMLQVTVTPPHEPPPPLWTSQKFPGTIARALGGDTKLTKDLLLKSASEASPAAPHRHVLAALELAGSFEKQRRASNRLGEVEVYLAGKHQWGDWESRLRARIEAITAVREGKPRSML